MQWARDLAAQALAITSQDWTSLGFSDDPQVAPSGDIDVITQRIVSLLAIRSVAMLSTLDDFEDYSTTTICRSILLNDNKWPAVLTEENIQELTGYVKRIVNGYQNVPYHNREHCYHVVLSANKLLDLMLNPDTQSNDNGHERNTEEGTNGNKNNNNNTNNHNSPRFHRQARSNPIPKTFGLRRDALQQMALLFAALIHDVHHGGVSNRQLALEDDPIAIVYNDASVLEQQSLTIAFTEFLQPEFAKFRKAVFPNREIYNGFRKTCVNLVLATDISNPDRMQITKDKWKTAFGDALGEQTTHHNDESNSKARRESGVTEITMPRHNMSNSARAESRRRSIGSMFSDITLNIWESGDEGSLSDSSDGGGLLTDQEFMMGADKDNAGSSCSGHHRSYTPDSSVAPPFLQKIDEGAEREQRKSGGTSNLLGIQNGGTNHTVTSQDLGYTKNAHSKEENGGKSEVVGTPASLASVHSQSSMPQRLNARRTNNNRRGSTTSVPEALAGYGVLRASAARQRRASFATGDYAIKKLQRRLSAVSAASCKTTGDLTANGKRHHKRLGIMRSIDLGGETIESYSRKGSMGTSSMAGTGISNKNIYFLEKYDEPDEFRATVVLETILLGCDVAHNLQSWDHMLKWSHRLYWELFDANKAGRGFDPSTGWCQGQAGFLQGYVLPLGEKLGKTGVFGVRVGKIFATSTQGIIEAWEADGEEVSPLLMSSRSIDRPPFR